MLVTAVCDVQTKWAIASSTVSPGSVGRRPPIGALGEKGKIPARTSSASPTQLNQGMQLRWQASCRAPPLGRPTVGLNSSPYANTRTHYTAGINSHTQTPPSGTSTPDISKARLLPALWVCDMVTATPYPGRYSTCRTTRIKTLGHMHTLEISPYLSFTMIIVISASPPPPTARLAGGSGDVVPD
uniref:Transposase n=1 Tax=Mesocestoides corti TaxID=53468 RepID=A0A5K3EZ70_MESCO